MKSIRGKISICMILTVVVSLLLVSSISIYLNYTSTAQTVELSMAELAESAARQVSNELKAYSNIAFETGSIERLTNPARTADEKRSIIEQRIKTHGLVRGGVINIDGISYADGMNHKDKQYFQEAVKGKTFVSSPIRNDSGSPYIMITAPLWKNGIPNSEVAGVVYYVPTDTFLNDIVSSIQISEHGTAYIINQDGYTVADNTMDTIMKQNVEQEVKSDSSLAGLAVIHEKMRQGESGFTKYKNSGFDTVVAYAPIEDSDGWSIALSAPTSDFLDSTIKVNYDYSCIVFCSFSGCSLYCFGVI